MMKNNSKLKKFLLNVAIILFIFFEEVLWIRIAKPIFDYIHEFKIVIRFKHYIKSLKNRYYILFLFLIPFILMEVSATLAIISLSYGILPLFIGFYLLKGLLMVPVLIIFKVQKDKLTSFYLIDKGNECLNKIMNSKLLLNTKAKIKELKEKFIEVFKTKKASIFSVILKKSKCIRKCLFN